MVARKFVLRLDSLIRYIIENILSDRKVTYM